MLSTCVKILDTQCIVGKFANSLFNIGLNDHFQKKKRKEKGLNERASFLFKKEKRKKKEEF